MDARVTINLSTLSTEAAINVADIVVGAHNGRLFKWVRKRGYAAPLATT